jgi:hypothetical protein
MPGGAMSFAQFLTLLVAACLVLISPLTSLFGLAFATAGAAQLSAVLFGIAVLTYRRGVAQWLPLAGWLALGALLANLVLPALGVGASLAAEVPGLGWVEIAWRLVFLLLLLRGQGGWGDGALLAMCVATSQTGSLALLLGLPFQPAPDAGDWQFPVADALAALAPVVAGLLALLGAGLALGWAAGWPVPRRWRILAWLGVLACVVQGVALLRA